MKVNRYDNNKEVHFHILEFDLGLIDDGKIIVITKANAHNDEEVTEIHFKNEYSFIQLIESDGSAEKDYYLSLNKIGDIFDITFESSMKNAL